VPADVGVNLSGSYDPGLHSGAIHMEFANSASSPLTARALVALTEDSIYYPATNGDVWHNHVLRDYVPDQNGTMVTIPALGQDTLTMSFVLDTSWDAARCNVVVYLQNPTLQPDSSKPVLQGGIVPVMQLSAVRDERRVGTAAQELTVFPNPCHGILQVRNGSARQAVMIRDASGRAVKELELGAGARASIDLFASPDGVYFVSTRGRANQSAKFLLTR
jgi:hypothetical protein